MPTVHFYDLPIYRLSEKEYGEELRELTKVTIPDPPSNGFPVLRKSIEDSRIALLAHYERHFGRWQFNEVVGDVQLSIVRRYITGSYFGRRVRETGPRHDEPILREVRTRTKVFVATNHPVLPLHIPLGSSNSKCLEIIVEYVNAWRTALPRRHLDERWLREIGSFVNWNAVVK